MPATWAVMVTGTVGWPPSLITRSPRSSSCTTPATEAVADDASTDTVPTRASPIIRALAVAAVRRGLRRPLRRASRPTAPPANGAVSTQRTGLDTAGLAAATPRKTATRPAPSTTSGCWSTVSVRTSAMAVPPAAASRSPSSARALMATVGSAWSSRIAATGATEEARRAGRTAARAVTTTPTNSVAPMVRGLTGRPDRSRPNSVLMSCCSPAARPIPAPRPATEPTRPTSNDSPSTDRVTWWREAPIARSSASSRVRWATSIENVLKMMNEPTNSATPANTPRKIVTNPSAWDRPSWVSSACA